MGQRSAVLKRVAGNRELRRVEFAFLGFGCAENGVWVSVLVYAYQQRGTAFAAAIAVIQLLPAAAFAPVAAILTDRRGGAVGLLVGYLAQVVSTALAAALLLGGGPPVAVLAAAVAAACAVTFTRPAHAALLPLLVHDPRELTAANVVTGWFDSSSFLAGPALAGLMISIDGPGLSLLVFAGTVCVSAVLVAPLVFRSRVPASTAPTAVPEADNGTGVLTALRAEPGAATLLGAVSLQYVGMGAIDVLVVVLAIKLLSLGPSGAGYLNAAFGAGGVAGGLIATALIGRHRMMPAFLASALAWGVAFLVLGAWPTGLGAFVLLAWAGSSRTVLDVSGRTLLQRVVPAEVRGRVFGVLEGCAMFGLALGSASIPLLALAGGPRASLVGIGLVLVLTAAATARVLARLDGRAPDVETELALLRTSSIFGVLSSPELEELARSLVPVAVTAGQIVVREGEPGDLYYLVEAGEVAVTVGDAETRRLGPGDGFGEIALLRDGLRTATVTAQTPTRLYSLTRSAFLGAVTGSQHAAGAAENVISERLGESAEPPPVLEQV